jgi:hypothetical protein
MSDNATVSGTLNCIGGPLDGHTLLDPAHDRPERPSGEPREVLLLSGRYVVDRCGGTEVFVWKPWSASGAAPEPPAWRTFVDRVGVRWVVTIEARGGADDAGSRDSARRNLVFRTRHRERVVVWHCDDAAALATLTNDVLAELLDGADARMTDFVWCPGCSRAYRPGDARWDRVWARSLCPTRGCTTPLSSALEWEEVLALHPGWPAEPPAGFAFPYHPITLRPPRISAPTRGALLAGAEHRR